MSSSANLRTCIASSTGIKPKTTISLDAEPTPFRLRRVERATRMTFSLGEALTTSTSLAVRPTFEFAIMAAASGEYDSDHSEKIVWYRSCTVDELDIADAFTSSTESGARASAARAAARPRMVATSACSPLIEADVLAASAASSLSAGLRALTAHSANIARCASKTPTMASEAPMGGGTPTSLPKTAAAFSTTMGVERASSLSSGFIGSAAPFVSMTNLEKSGAM
mmetsp:Transcript_27655/g.70499  ORF Transcript_27655/g.70499 Transcript_27655/m.70499 type:complete len:225 (+) Transcript_27655:729-1403(+)